MTPRSRSRCALSAAALFAGLAPAAVLADITGFGDLSAFQINRSDTGSLYSYDQGSGTLHLTTLSDSEDRSVFALAPQQAGHFTASFTYTALNYSSAFGNTFGPCFVIQNSAAGAGALGGSFGYAGIGSSIAVSLEIGDGGSRSGLYTNGQVGGGSVSVAPVDLTSGHPIRCALSYDGSFLSETLTDTVTQQTFHPSAFIVNIPTLVGGSTAYVGITANTQIGGRADQYFSDFQFSSVPSPAAGSLLVVGAGCLSRRRCRAGAN